MLSPSYTFENLIIPTARTHIHLVAETPWEQRIGRMGPTPRLVAWYGSGPYRYSGIRHEARPLTPLLETLREIVQKRTGENFQGVLLNYYKDGSNSVAWHADDEPEMGPVVASLTFGSPRVFKLRQKSDHTNVHSFELGDADLFVMHAGTQEEWEHSIPKTKRAVGPRVNLTFRQLRS
jgi:alkylated DNA repair dioxygenase AlkB